MTDMGVPDGFVGAVVVKPNRFVAVHAGGGHNTMAPGLRAGVQLFAFEYPAAPYAALEIGHYFRGPAAGWAEALARDAAGDDAMSEDVSVDDLGYSYGNAHLGLRLGGARAAFFIQGGVSRVHADATVRRHRVPDGPTLLEVDVYSRSALRTWTPSARLGLEAWF
ncbi:hypothetical protein [Haliangium sp.]|uniref:hypothetical protein n=1 Tax=Haliangium sp. TaxID=2663208 RepID=UPI003D0AE3E2